MEYERFYELMTRGLESHMKIGGNRINQNVRFFYDFFNGKDFDEDTVKKLSTTYQIGITTGKTIRWFKMSSNLKEKVLIK